MSNQGTRAPLTDARKEELEAPRAQPKTAAEADAEEEESDEEFQEGVMVKILPYVFIGDAYAATNVDKIKQNDITHIVNLVHDDVDNQFDDFVKYLNVACSATIDDPIDEHFEQVAKFILGVKEAEGKVLVHCVDGMELAPAFMVAYMLIASFEKHKKLPLKDALAHVEKLKPDVAPNDGFISKLIALEKKLFGCVSMKLDRSSGKSVATGGGVPHYLGRGKGRKLGNKRGQRGGPRR